jgi:hypothetical protein
MADGGDDARRLKSEHSTHLTISASFDTRPAPRPSTRSASTAYQQLLPYLTDGEAWGNTESIGAGQHSGGNSKHRELHVGSDACYATNVQIMDAGVIADHSLRRRLFRT